MPVYIVHTVGTDRYKIGYTRNVERRRRQLEKAAIGQRLRLILTIAGNEEAERVLHHRYAERGRDLVGEWFRLTPADLKEIKASKAELEIEFQEESEKPKSAWGINLRAALRTLEKDRRKVRGKRARERKAAQIPLRW